MSSLKWDVVGLFRTHYTWVKKPLVKTLSSDVLPMNGAYAELEGGRTRYKMHTASTISTDNNLPLYLETCANGELAAWKPRLYDGLTCLRPKPVFEEEPQIAMRNVDETRKMNSLQ